jgi:hypothetical protein
MDYQFDLQRTLQPTVLIDAAGSRAIEFTLGFVPDQDTIIVMSVMLIPTERPDVFELCFGIRAKEITNEILLASQTIVSRLLICLSQKQAELWCIT